MAIARVAMLVPLLLSLAAPAALAQQPSPAATPALDAHSRIAAEKLIAEARELYYADKAPNALDDIAKATQLLDGTAFVPLQDRVQLQLWRAAIFLASNADTAAAEAREAIALDPTQSIDLSIFPPAVAELVDKVKAAPPASHHLVVRGIPAGARVFLDGRQIWPGATVLEGRHWLDVDCPGYTHRVAAFDAVAVEPVVIDGAPTPLPRATPAPTPIPRTPLARRPLFWGIVAAGALAVGGGIALAYTPSARTTDVPDGQPPKGTVTWH